MGARTPTCLPSHDRLERGSQRYLGLAVAYVATHQPVHGAFAFHVAFDLGERGQLVGCFLVWEGLFQLLLPGGVRTKGVSGDHFAGGVESEKFGSHLAGGTLGSRFGAAPFLCAQTCQVGRGVARRDVWRDPIEMFQRNVEFVAVGVF